MTVGFLHSWGNVQFRSQSLCLRIKFTRLPLIILDILIDSITKILRRLIFPSFLPRKGEQDLFLSEISVFFFFNISDFSSLEREKQKFEKFSIDNLRGLKYYSPAIRFVKFQL